MKFELLCAQSVEVSILFLVIINVTDPVPFCDGSSRRLLYPYGIIVLDPWGSSWRGGTIVEQLGGRCQVCWTRNEGAFHHHHHNYYETGVNRLIFCRRSHLYVYCST